MTTFLDRAFAARTTATPVALFRITFTLACMLLWLDEVLTLEWVWFQPAQNYAAIAMFLYALWFVSLLALLLGYRTTAAAVISFVLFRAVHLHPRFEDIVTKMLALGCFYLMFMQSGRALSMDARRSPDEPRVVPMWPVVLAIADMGLLLLTSGLSKLADPDWRSGFSLYAILVHPELVASSWRWLTEYPTLCTAFNFWVIAVEVSFAILVWFPYVRWLALINYAALVVGIAAALNFTYVGLLGIPFLFLGFGCLRKEVGPITPRPIARWLVWAIMGYGALTLAVNFIGVAEFFKDPWKRSSIYSFAPTRWYTRLVRAPAVGMFTFVREDWPWLWRVEGQTRSGRVLDLLPRIPSGEISSPFSRWKIAGRSTIKLELSAWCNRIRRGQSFTAYWHQVDRVATFYIQHHDKADPLRRITFWACPIEVPRQFQGRSLEIGEWRTAIEVLIQEGEAPTYRWVMGTQEP